MGKQSIRQAARRTALDAQARRRARHAEREKRLECLAVQVLVAIRERDQQIAQSEHRAGEALAQMTQEGLAARDLVEWCGGELTPREVTRLRRLATVEGDPTATASGADQPPAARGGGHISGSSAR